MGVSGWPRALAERNKPSGEDSPSETPQRNALPSEDSPGESSRSEYGLGELEQNQLDPDGQRPKGQRLNRLQRRTLPRSMSLKSKVDIDRLFKKGRRSPGDCFQLFWETSDLFLYGVFVGRRLGGAVERNRIKRVYREAIRLNKDQLSDAVAIAVVPRPGPEKQTFEQVNAEINRIFRRISADPASN